MLAVSAAAWGTLVAKAEGPTVPTVCSASASWGVPTTEAFGLALALNPPATLLTNWALMLAAMMTPLLLAPLQYVHARSFARWRARALLLFVAGYCVVWMSAGVVLAALALTLRLGGQGPALTVGVGVAAALTWQASPAKQRCLNGCHARPALAAFGAAADLSVFRFGLNHGAWCVGSCGILMTLCLLAPRAHVPVMAVVAVWVFLERLDRPASPRWRTCLPSRTLRIAATLFRARFTNGRRILKIDRTGRARTIVGSL